MLVAALGAVASAVARVLERTPGLGLKPALVTALLTSCANRRAQ